MGKGGTRFVGDAVGVAKKSRGPNRKKDLEKFLETGVHPEFERNLGQAAVTSLPEQSTTRPYVFMEFAVDKQTIGRVAIELFEDVAPIAVALFQSRCVDGASDSFAGTRVHQILPQMAVRGGLNPRYGSGVHVKRYPALQHMERGAVALSLTGAEFSIAVARAPHLDESYQVVGRVSEGFEVLEKLNAIPTSADDAPLKNVRLARCGFKSALAPLESAGEAGASGKETAEETAQRLKREAAEARDALKEALQVGLGKKQAAEEAGPAQPVVRRGMMASMLGDLSSDDSDSGEDPS